MKPPGSVLLIAYPYPPMGGAGAPRMWQFSLGLASRGWRVTVLSVEKVSHPYPDESLHEELPGNVRVVRTESRDLLRLVRRIRERKAAPQTGQPSAPGIPSGQLGEFLRRAGILLCFPDTRQGWIRPALSEAARLVAESRPDVIISSSPPASAHAVAVQLKERTGIRWVADLRDPLLHFLYPSQYPTWIHRRRIASFQKKVLEQADAVIANTPGSAAYYGRILPGLSDRMVTITNGFDPGEFEEPVEPSGEFLLLHTGTLAAEQHPGTFLQGLEWALARRPELADHLQVVFLGDVRAEAQRRIRWFESRSGIRNLVRVKPPVPHHEAVREMRRAFALLLILHSGPGTETIVPSKLYEYMAAARPVLAVCPPGDARRLAEEYPEGLPADFDHPEEIGNQILRAHDLFRSDPRLAATDQTLLSRYTWETKLAQLERLLSRILPR